MWQPESVERALFHWVPWKQSIIRQWIKTPNSVENVAVLDIKKTAKEELEGLKFSNSLWLQLYWICCTSSEYNLGHPNSFEKIVIPEWLPMPFDPSMDQYHLVGGMRMYAPAVWDEGDVKFIAQHRGFSIGKNGFYVHFVGEEKPVIFRFPFVHRSEKTIFVRSDHDFHNLLSNQRGRLNKSKTIGRIPSYSD